LTATFSAARGVSSDGSGKPKASPFFIDHLT
jgi:hypothetical protein